jgi:hypothetical protein
VPRTALASSPLRRGLALGVGLALAVPTGLAAGPRSALAAVKAPAEDPALAQSRALYDEGKAKFDTFDYEGAADLWTKAYAKLPETEAGVRNAMVYNIATAQEKAYELDKDVQHLRQAVLLLEQYVKTYKVMFSKTPETKAEVDKAEGRIAQLKERIGRAERGEDATPQPPTGGTPPTAGTPPVPGFHTNDGIVWSTSHNPPPDQELLAKNRRLAAEEKKTDRMLIASYVTLSVGGLFLLSGAGAVYGGSRLRRDSDPDAGSEARGAGYGSLALGLAGVATGVTLMVIGFERRKKAKDGTLVAATPVLAPGFAGASLRVRF